MNTGLMAAAAGAMLMAGSTLTFAEDWEDRHAVTSVHYVHRDGGGSHYGGHDPGHCNVPGHVHYHVHGYYTPYRPHHHHHWRPYPHYRHGPTIIFRIH